MATTANFGLLARTIVIMSIDNDDDDDDEDDI